MSSLSGLARMQVAMAAGLVAGTVMAAPAPQQVYIWRDTAGALRFSAVERPGERLEPRWHQSVAANAECDAVEDTAALEGTDPRR